MTDTMEITTTPLEMTKEGQRHIAVGEYNTAVEVLARACELLAKEHGDTADECADAYFWYGKALLSLSREERGILGGVMAEAENAAEDANDEDSEEKEEVNGGEDDNNVEMEEPEKGEEKTEKGEEKTEKGEETKEKVEENIEKVEEKTETTEVDKKGEEVLGTKKEETADKDKKEMEVDATKEDNATEKEATEEAANEDGEEVGSDVEGDDEVDNLQLAWEMLELSRGILKRRGENSSLLAEVYLCLGEVALESETYDKAVVDMQSCLEIQKKLYDSDDRRIAETHYQIGLANSLSSNFEDAVTHFKNAVNILESCIKKLQDPSTPTTDFKEKEIKQLQELIPEIQEKIQDMLDCKAETVNLVREKLMPTNGAGPSSSSSVPSGSRFSAPSGSKFDAPSSKFGAPSSSNGAFVSSSSDDKPAANISHLVKRKRKASESDEATVPKKANT